MGIILNISCFLEKFILGKKWISFKSRNTLRGKKEEKKNGKRYSALYQTQNHSWRQGAYSKEDKFCSIPGGLQGCQLVAPMYYPWHVSSVICSKAKCDHVPSAAFLCFPQTQHLSQAAKPASQPASLRASCSQPHLPLWATLLLPLPLCWDLFCSPRPPPLPPAVFA